LAKTSEISIKISDLMLKHQKSWQHWFVSTLRRRLVL